VYHVPGCVSTPCGPPTQFDPPGTTTLGPTTGGTVGKREGVPLRVRSGDGVPVNVGETVTEGVSVLDRLDPKDVVGVTVAVIVDEAVTEGDAPIEGLGVAVAEGSARATHWSVTLPSAPLPPKPAPPSAPYK
jgi:hypothetical protein